jgi:hypothetical protein
MAEYTFGANILRYVQNQDELNIRAKQLQTEEERYKTQQSFAQTDWLVARFWSAYARRVGFGKNWGFRHETF